MNEQSYIAPKLLLYCNPFIYEWCMMNKKE